jgi:hypothetical protein
MSSIHLPHILSPYYYTGHERYHLYYGINIANFITVSATNDTTQCVHIDNGVSVDVLHGRCGENGRIADLSR